jgi:hypothetical protein
LWFGKGCTGDEREFAKNISQTVVSREYEVVTEGAESAAFWEALGGKEAYAAAKTESDSIVKEARLFQCTNAVGWEYSAHDLISIIYSSLLSGYFRVEEIFDFDQEDLIEEDVMILDTYAEVFVWIGKGANVEEKKAALETAVEYIKTDQSGRTIKNTVLATLKQGYEPPNFTCHFIAWNPDKWSQGKTYEQLKAEAQAAGNTSVLQGSVQESLSKFTNAVYTHAQLTTTPLPEGIDVTKKEQYLSPDEFEQLFGMTKAAFNAMPAWKHKGLKQKVGLY